MKIRQILLEFVKDKSYQGITPEEIAKIFDVKDEDLSLFFDVLRDLEKEGLIRMTRKGRVMPGGRKKERIIQGIFSATDKGFGFLIPEDEDMEDLFIPTRYRHGAMDGDKVAVKLDKNEVKDRRNFKEKSDTAKVIKILERKTTKLVGTLVKNRNFGFVIPDNHKFDEDVYLEKREIKGLSDGDKIVVSVEYPKKRNKGPSGKVIERLGNENTPGVDITAIARNFNLPYKFNKNIIRETEKLDSDIIIGNRKDYRDELTVTIDGETAKDFDDAIAIEKKNDDYLLKIHIADVAHFVKPNSFLDKEAYNRGNSVYLLDRVIPMLPERISNDLCSLMPNKDRYTLTVELLISSKGDIKSYDFFESVIKSSHRLYYHEVSDFLENKDLPFDEDDLKEMLILFKELYEILALSRKDRGSLDFNFKESDILLNDEGKVIEVRPVERRIGNKIIEEFMIITNEVIGEHFAHMELPFLYRVHEKPTDEKSKELRILLHNLNYTIKGKEIMPSDLQKILDDSMGKKEQSLLHMLILRSLSKAHYTSEPLGHFGLATRFYSHFTAPIRRYSDLIIHRIVKDFINTKPLSYDEKTKNKLDIVGEHVSNTERRAEEAEREVADLKKTEYMVQFIGEEFDGIISSVTSFGIFIQLENTIEGMIHIKNLSGDYEFDEKNLTLASYNKKHIFNPGDEIRIRVEDANPERRRIDFALVEEGEYDESISTK